MPHPEFYISVSQEDWGLHRKGEADQARHKQRVKDAIRNNLPGIVGEEAIITSDGKTIVKVPIRSLDLPRFRYNPKKGEGVGQGSGDSKVGDVIAQEPGSSGKGKGAGNEPGVDYYEAEITVDELAEMVFADLALPNLQPKSQDEEETTDRFTEIRKRGPLSNLHKIRTVRENIKRNAKTGKPSFGDLSEGDLRFRSSRPHVERKTNAVVIAMRDISSSMGEFEKYISRGFYFWMVRFLRTKYDTVKIVFIAHHTEAKEVEEQAFFNLGESGGTRVSSAYQLSLDIINKRFSPDLWNIYPFHFSDGDNWGDDNTRCLELVRKHLEICNLFGYGEIQEKQASGLSTLMGTFSAIDDQRFIGVRIGDKKEVYPALRKFFGKELREGGVSRA
ncbi:MAG: sporulation protein YhbH [Candidatus Blackburnbacteria bacterium]|nr:sporulation protein YhbH [Candidatus Blackburnbacteria bacterium]